MQIEFNNVNTNFCAYNFCNESMERLLKTSTKVQRLVEKQQNNPVEIFVNGLLYGGNKKNEIKNLEASVFQNIENGSKYKIKENWFERIFSPKHFLFMQRCAWLANIIKIDYPKHTLNGIR